MDFDNKKYTLSEIADRYSLSVATLRNWIKEGHLEVDEVGNLHSSQLEVLKTLLTLRMTSRANKQYKSPVVDDSAISVSRLLKSDVVDSDQVSALYQSALSESYRNHEGIYYTPDHVACDMMCHMGNVSDKTFLEPCCGGGAFVVEAIRRGFRLENIYAYDTDPIAVEITRKRVYDMTGCHSDNIRCADFLKDAQKEGRRFDFIYTNPPWGKKISVTLKRRYAEIYGSGKSRDTASLFLSAAMGLLSADGEMGFLLPDSFFNIASFEDSRRLLMKHSLVRVVDYGHAFPGLMAKACAVVLRNSEPSSSSQVACGYYGHVPVLRLQQGFASNPKSIINYWVGESVSRVISYLYSLSHLSLSGNAEWALGVVTGSNAERCHKEQGRGMVPVYRGKDITPQGVASPHLFIDEHLQGCRQVAPMHLYTAPEKVVYRFISDRLVCCCDDRQRLFLNSANMFVLHSDFPLTHNQVAALLNSRLINWIFKSLYNTRKVLRADLETLPLYVCGFGDQFCLDEQEQLRCLHLFWNERSQTYEMDEGVNV